MSTLARAIRYREQAAASVALAEAAKDAQIQHLHLAIATILGTDRFLTLEKADGGSIAHRGRESLKLRRGRTTCPEVLETARNPGKATAEVACCCELCLDRLPRAVGSG